MGSPTGGVDMATEYDGGGPEWRTSACAIADRLLLCLGPDTLGTDSKFDVWLVLAEADARRARGDGFETIRSGSNFVREGDEDEFPMMVVEF